MEENILSCFAEENVDMPKLRKRKANDELPVQNVLFCSNYHREDQHFAEIFTPTVGQKGKVHLDDVGMDADRSED